MSLLALGTAQWGAGYGLTNAIGRLDDDAVRSIATAALDAGVMSVDTAAGYGDAQRRLLPWAKDFDITTKVAGAEPGRIRESLIACLRDLGRESVEACLLHDWDGIDPDIQPAAAAALEAARDEGLVQVVGVSVYEESPLTSALANFTSLEAVQVPANALDRRLDRSQPLADLWAAGAKVQVRSALLQGLLAARSDVPLASHPAVRAFHEVAQATGVDPLILALAHVKALPWASEIVIGVTSAEEFAQVLGSWETAQPRLADAQLASDDLCLVDPRRWGGAPASVRMAP